MSDGLQAILDASKLSKAQRAGIWDLYQAAKNEDDLDARLKSLDIPKDIKADLWDLKHSASGARADGTAKGGGFFGTLQRPDGRVSTELSIGVGFDGKETQIPLLVPSLSQREVDTLLSLKDDDPIPDAIADKAVKYAKLRMQAGKPVFAEPSEVGKFTPLPGEFKGERNRVDNQVLGMPPEAAALGALQVGRAVVAPAVNAAARVAAGAKAAAGQALPIAGSEAVRHGLKAVGVPEPFASIGADLVLAHTLRGKGAKAATVEAEAEAAAPAVAAETTPHGFPKPTEPQLSPLEFSRKLKAEHQAKMAAETQLREQVKDFVKQTAAKEHFTASETAKGLKLLQQGLTAAEAKAQILLLRSESFKRLPQ